MLAALEGRAGIVSLLLSAKADVTRAHVNTNDTAITIATNNGHQGIVQLLAAHSCHGNTATATATAEQLRA